MSISFVFIGISDYCPPVSSLENGTIACDAAALNDLCEYNCSEGYVPIDSPATCEAGGHGSGFGVWSAACEGQN